MADTKVKNIVTVDVLEDSTNKENILVESQGGLKRLPISKVKGSGGGGSGAGFDIMGKVGSEVVVTTGGELVEWEDTEWTPTGEPTFEEIFGTGTFDQSNVYKTNCTVVGFGTYVIYGFYYSSNSAWAVAIPDLDLGTEELSTVATVKMGVIVETSITFAQLQEIKENRPISVLVKSIGDGLDYYFYSSMDKTVMLASEAQDEGKTIQEFLLSEFGIDIGDSDVIMLYCLAQGKDSVMASLLLWEDGTEEDPVLGTYWVIDD